MFKKKQFCINGHDTFVCGRLLNRCCKVCYAVWLEKHRIPVHLRGKKFCINRHEISVVGRNQYGMCKECHRQRAIGWYKTHKNDRKKYNETHKKNLLDYQRKHEKTEKRIKSKKEYRKTEIFKEINRRYQRTSKRRKYIRKYNKKHPEIYILNSLKQHSTRKLRISKFGQENIKEFYITCPRNKVIDHIIPLQGKNVSGLHVSWNLQYLTTKQNSSKGNKVDLLKASKQYGKLLEKLGLK